MFFYEKNAIFILNSLVTIKIRLLQMRIILLISLTISLNSFGQSKSQKNLEKDFVNEYCNCLEKFASAEPDKVLYNLTETCIRNFFNSKGKEVEQILKERDWGNSSTLSDYEKGGVVGKEMIYNAIDDLVKDCKFYRKTLSEYKTILMNQLKITKESVDTSIAEFKSKEGMIKDEKSKATYFTLLGIMYEFVGEKKEALNAYDNSLETYPTTQAKGLRLLLKME